MAKISIIIPVYNVEPYIKKCLDSVLTQTYTDLEILLINDGSTDNSGQICDEYATVDPRIKLFHVENGGLSSALNIGLAHATGGYIGFVDSDDWIEAVLYETLRGAIDGADIAVCSYYKDKGTHSEAMNNQQPITNDVIKTENMLLYPLMRDGYMGFCGYVWNKLYRADVIRRGGVRFDENIKYGMDVLFYTALVSTENCTGRYINKPLYHYVQRGGAITKSESFDIKTDILTVYKRVEELLPQKHKFWARGFYCYHASVIYELAVKKSDIIMARKMRDEIRAHIGDYIRTNEEYPHKIKRMEDFLCSTLNP
jgi:glycosyltransferase involved in cell wall biosynthesis